MKRIIIAVILSGVVWPGTGQLYNRDFKKGAVLIALTALLIISFILSISKQIKQRIPEQSAIVDMKSAREISEAVMKDSPTPFRTFNFLMTAVWLFSIIDAFLVARAKISKKPPGPPQGQSFEP